MGVLVPWLVDAARLTGYPTIEVAGWKSHGHGSGMLAVQGVVLHHTADGPVGDFPSLHIVRNGRAGLTGPLANFGLGRSGQLYVITAGVCHHAGASSWAGYTDLNDEFLGIECESVGVRDDVTQEQRDCYPRLVAACLYYMRRSADRAAGHKEVCLPRGRKIDPAFFNMDELRSKTKWMLANPLFRIPKASPLLPPSQRTGGLVIPVSLPRTEAPSDWDKPKSEWPQREEIINLGWIGGWHGLCRLRMSFGHPGAFLLRAHVDYPGNPTKIVDWVRPPGFDVHPAYKQTSELFFEVPEGAGTLMITYAAPSGGSLNIEREK